MAGKKYKSLGLSNDSYSFPSMQMPTSGTIDKSTESKFYEGYGNKGKSYGSTLGYANYEPDSQAWGSVLMPTSTDIPKSANIGQSSLGQTLAPSASYLDKMKKFSNESFGTGFNLSASGQYDTTGMTADAEGNFYSNPAHAIKMDTNMQGMPTANSTGLGFDAGDIAAGIDAAANLANAYIGYKNYGLAKDKFGFEKAATNRNIENQAQQYNAELQNRGEIGLALGGASISPEQRANTLAQMERQKISGAAIG